MQGEFDETPKAFRRETMDILTHPEISGQHERNQSESSQLSYFSSETRCGSFGVADRLSPRLDCTKISVIFSPPPLRDERSISEFEDPEISTQFLAYLSMPNENFIDGMQSFNSQTPKTNNSSVKRKNLYAEARIKMMPSTTIYSTKDFGGFASASGKSFKMPGAAALEKASDLLNLEADSCYYCAKSPIHSVPSSSFCDFAGLASTSEKSLNNPVKDAIETANILLKLAAEPCSLYAEPAIAEIKGNNCGGFSSASGKSFNVPGKAALEKANLLLGLNAVTFRVQNVLSESETDNYGGFAMATGAPLKPPSIAALEKANLLFHLDTESLKSRSNIAFDMNQTNFEMDERNINIPELSVNISKTGKEHIASSREDKVEPNSSLVPIYFDSEDGVMPNFELGFTTAKKKLQPLSPSASSIAKNNEFMSSLLMPFDPVIQFAGFSTAAGAKLAEPARLKARGNFNEQSESRISTPTNTRMKKGEANVSSCLSGAELKHLRLNDFPTPKRRDINDSANSTPLASSSRTNIKNSPFRVPTLVKKKSIAKSSLNLISGIPKCSVKKAGTTGVPFTYFDITVQKNVIKLETLFESFSDRGLIDFDSEVGRINPENAVDATFLNCEKRFGVKDAHELMLKLGGIESLLSLRWISNHFKWIVWKTAATVRRLPNCSHLWDWNFIVQQLQYRYEIEVNHAKRSSLRLIIERDDSAGKYLILCVSKIDLVNHKPIIELTDGWYSISAKFDRPLLHFVRSGKIFVGSKLRIQGAHLVGSSEAVAALDITMATQLSISANGTKLASGASRLGYQPMSVYAVCLASIISEGGTIPCLDVFVESVYPVMFTEGKISRSEREESINNAKHEKDYSNAYHFATQSYEQNPQFFADLDISGDLHDCCIEYCDQKFPKRNVSKQISMKVCDYPSSGISLDNCRHARITIWCQDNLQLELFQEGKRFLVV